MEKQIGETFISKALGSRLLVRYGDAKGRCEHCVFKNDNYCCSGLMRTLRQLDVGHCSKKSRSDNLNVYFEQLESLYTIPKETVKLMEEINFSYSKSKENSILLLLDFEYLSYLEKLNKK